MIWMTHPLLAQYTGAAIRTTPEVDICTENVNSVRFLELILFRTTSWVILFILSIVGSRQRDQNLFHPIQKIPEHEIRSFHCNLHDSLFTLFSIKIPVWYPCDWILSVDNNLVILLDLREFKPLQLSSLTFSRRLPHRAEPFSTFVFVENSLSSNVDIDMTHGFETLCSIALSLKECCFRNLIT